MPIAAVWLIILFIVPLSGTALPFVVDPEVEREKKRTFLADKRTLPMWKYTHKLTAGCDKQCTKMCSETLSALTLEANMDCEA
jgi:hypothetical protein